MPTGTIGGTITGTDGTTGGTSGNPGFAFTVNGAAYDYKAGGIEFDELVPYSRDGVPTLSWTYKGGPLLTTADPFRGKSITLSIDAGNGLGSVLRFAGDCTDRETPYVSGSPGVGWTRRYTALGLRNRMDWVPLSNSNDGSDLCSYNLDLRDPKYNPALAGRSAGQCLQDALDQPDNARALQAMGIGNYASTGYGASATTTLVSGQVQTPSMTSGGTGYATAPTVLFYGGGGYGARGYAVVSGGVVTGIVITNHGSGYKTPPQVILSGLPAITLNDLAGLAVVYPAPVSIQGERLGGAIDATLRQVAPNYAFHVDPSGNMRFLDLRALGQPLILFLNSSGTGARATATVNPATGAITGYVVVSGGTAYDDANPPDVVIIDATGTGATAACTSSGGVITAVTPGSSGSNYSYPRTLTMGLGPDRVDVGGVQFRDSVRDCSQRVVVRGQRNVQAVTVETATAPGQTSGNNGLAEDFSHDGLTSNQAKLVFKSSDDLSPGQDPGRAIYTATVNPSTKTVTGFVPVANGYGYTPGIVPGVHVSPPGGGGTTATGTAVMSSDGTQVASVSLGTGGSNYTAATVIIDSATAGGADGGTCTVSNSTTVVLTSQDPTKTCAAGYWDGSPSGKKGQIILIDPVLPGVNARVRANVVSNTAMTAGGTMTVVIDAVLPLTSYSSYTLVGLAGGAQRCWRNYKVTDAAIAGALQTTCDPPVFYVSASGNLATQTSTPIVSVLYSANGLPPYDEETIPAIVDTVAGEVITQVPVVSVYGNAAANAIGGSHTTGIPSSVRALLLVSKGQLTATYPPDVAGSPQYGGTSHTVDGLSRTLTVTAPSWKIASNQGNLLAYAQDIFDSVSDTRLELHVPTLGLYEPALSFGLALDLAGQGYTTGYESAAIPVLECSLKWNPGPGSRYSTVMRASNRRSQHAAELFSRPTPTPMDLGVQDTTWGGFAPSFGGGGGEGLDFGGYDA